MTREIFDQHPGIPIQVVDTIGAGDAFTAALASYYLQGAALPVLNEAGNRWGSWVASQAGAMPALSDQKRTEIEGAIIAAQQRKTAKDGELVGLSPKGSMELAENESVRFRV